MMDTKQNESTIIHVLKNSAISFILTALPFVGHIMSYYQVSRMEAISIILFQEIATLLYFLLVWIFNYLVLALTNMVSDVVQVKTVIFKKAVAFIVLPVVTLLILWMFLPTLFRLNGLFLVTFLTAKALLIIIKQKIDS